MKVPLVGGIFTPYDPHFMAYFGSIVFANMGGGGGQNCFQKGSLRNVLRKSCGKFHGVLQGAAQRGVQF